jgi:hypothetical protein
MWGVLFEFDAAEKPLLNEAEALGRGYDELIVEVESETGRKKVLPCISLQKATLMTLSSPIAGTRGLLWKAPLSIDCHRLILTCYSHSRLSKILIAHEIEGIGQLPAKSIGFDPRSSAQIRGRKFFDQCYQCKSVVKGFHGSGNISRSNPAGTLGRDGI